MVKLLIAFFAFVVVHWSLARIYVKFCTPSSFDQILSSFINLGSPFCQIINNTQYLISQNYILIYSTFSSFLVTRLLGSMQYNPNQIQPNQIYKS